MEDALKPGGSSQSWTLKEYELLEGRYPGWNQVGRNSAEYLLFEHGGDLHMLLPDGQVQTCKGWAEAGDEKPVTNDDTMEEAAEEAYWSFDADRKKWGMERDAFKGQFRRAWRSAKEVQPTPACKATRLDLPYLALRWQEVPGGTLLTCCQVIQGQPGIVGAPSRLIPASTVFLPDVYIVEAIDPKGNPGVFVVQVGVNLEELGLTKAGDG